ncbi:glycosyltransferase family 2 protein [Actinomycetospora cinnamomea]|uniref:Glycosyl transferase family 2 n=1 Tax=Actinomycetospora cinnamomea TaxID=663609 RepID=A0A2U1EVK0_9PSEU|nr:glycosyltransferase family 2 protein [Actinomycetospora cinnamomea]PVZ03939.1 glycosyl transferase family 2 [Actinomycetospora cinnamomea]
MDEPDGGGGRRARVSVCVPLRDKVDYVGATIDSVLAQTFADFELVVVDNASTDGSSAVVDRYDDPRVRVVRHAETLSMIDNFNATVAATRAPLVKVLTADDLIEPQALARQVAVMEAEPDVAVVSSRHHLVDDRNRIVARDRALPTADLLGRQGRAAVVRRVVRDGGNPLGVPGDMLFRRSAFDAVGGFPTDDSFVLDVALAVRLTTAGDFYGLAETLSRFRLAVDSAGAADRRRSIRAQRAFVQGLQREHGDVVRRRDVAWGWARWPLTSLHHRAVAAASSDPDSWRHRATAPLFRSGDRPDRRCGATDTRGTPPAPSPRRSG